MARVTSYFSHDSNARNNEKILQLRMRHGAAGYGVFFMILERLRDSSDYMSVKDYNMIAFDLRVDAKIIKSVVEDFGLFAFTVSGECFYSESFIQRMAIKDETTQARSEAGRKGAASRWDTQKTGENMANASISDSKRIANAWQMPSETIARKESKVSKESKGYISPPNPPFTEDDGAEEYEGCRMEEVFAEFWNLYPKKYGEAACLREWCRLNPAPELVDQIMKSLRKHIESEQWIEKDGRYIPNPYKWLKEERWKNQMRPQKATFADKWREA